MSACFDVSAAIGISADLILAFERKFPVTCPATFKERKEPSRIESKLF